MHAVQNSAANWDEPDKFMPERWNMVRLTCLLFASANVRIGMPVIASTNVRLQMRIVSSANVRVSMLGCNSSECQACSAALA